jgi:3-phosphoshikimate 1-carboxyvinyltransferase
MSLPDLIEIVPLKEPVRAEITVPGSKSITNRALVLAALADGPVTLRGALWSEDTQVMTDCLRALGFTLEVQPDPDEVCNRTITVQGRGGTIPRAGTEQEPLDLFVGNAGTAARFLSALACLGRGVYRLHGVTRMHERPQAALFQALRELGYRIDSPNDRLPAVIHGTGPRAGKCRASIEESSQFASALLLCAKAGGWQVEIVGENAEESPYVAMTSEMIKVFPQGGGEFPIEPDASSGSYFWAVAEPEAAKATRIEVSGKRGCGYVESHQFTPSVVVRNWPTSGWQIDEKYPLFAVELSMQSSRFGPVGNTPDVQSAESFLEAWQNLGYPQSEKPSPAEDSWSNQPTLLTISRRTDVGDSIMTAIVWASLAEEAVKFVELGRLRVQECERVVAVRTELTKCGAKVEEEGDTLTVFPSCAQLHGAEIETYNDHRMAMCFAILGLKVPGIKIKNPACVKKTFPNFFQKLAAPPPRGLGATILDATKNPPVPLKHEELFAD